MNDSADAMSGVHGDVVWSVDPATCVATVEIRRGPHNFFDIGLIDSIADTYAGLASATSARAIVLRSEGRNFCAGADLARGPESIRRPDGVHLYDAAIRLFDQPLPVVAAVQGAAIGGGLGLALSADFRVATPASRFAANFALIGFHHGFGMSVTLPNVVGMQRAMDLLYTGRRISGVEAARIGLADRVAEDDDPREAATALAAEIARAAPLAVRSIRWTLRHRMVDELRRAVVRERDEQERLQATLDFGEGKAAVAERRPAVFQGRLPAASRHGGHPLGTAQRGALEQLLHVLAHGPLGRFPVSLTDSFVDFLMICEHLPCVRRIVDIAGTGQLQP
jgi:2-(1,2-epoxy-1,2-dihydrophenyl)acetyl-CoA isomerase